MFRKFVSLAFIALLMGACATVDETEACVKTRFGKVIEQSVETGIHPTWMMFDFTCFDMTSQTFPDDGDREVEIITAQTSDPVTLDAELQVIWRYDPETIYQVFLDKRTEDAVEREIRGAIRSGARNAINSFSIDEVFSEQRAAVEAEVQAAIQRSIGERAIVENAFLRDLAAPAQIEEARIAATEQEQRLQQAQKEFQVDSVNAEAQILTAQADAEAKRLEGAAYNENPALLQLRAAEALAQGLATACSGVTTCILGGDVMDRFLSGVNR